MNKATATPEECITDYVTGFARRNPSGLAHLASYPNWQRAAASELQSRVTRFIGSLTDEDLAAVASGAVSINKIAQSLQAQAKT